MNFRELFGEISPADPCGVDPYEDPQLYAKFKALDELVRETAEQPIPDWAKLEQECEALLKKTRHLRVMVLAAVAAMYRDKGFSGAQAALEYIRDSLKFEKDTKKDDKCRFWDFLHPRLNGNDATQRLSELNELSTALADDPPNPMIEDGVFLYYLRRRPLFSTPSGQWVSLRAFELAGNPSAGGVSLADVQKARAALPASDRALLMKSLEGMQGALDDMEAFLSKRKARPNWQRLRRVIESLKSLLSQPGLRFGFVR